MARIPKTERRATKVSGVIFPEAAYDTDAVMDAAGIGRVKLMALRQSGRLKPGRLDGEGRAWYRGSDLLALIFNSTAKGA